jgi:hypothetical protein
MVVLFLKDGLSHSFDAPNSSSGLIDCFDPTTTLYFFEPGGGSLNTQPLYEDIDAPTLATMSALGDRCKDFRKVASELHMPPFKVDELVDIGRHISKHEDFQSAPDELRRIYDENTIRVRFKRYNGIIRHVLPHDMDAVVSLEFPA